MVPSHSQTMLMVATMTVACASDLPRRAPEPRRRTALKLDNSWDEPNKPLEQRLFMAAAGGHHDAVMAFVQAGAKIDRRGTVRRAPPAQIVTLQQPNAYNQYLLSTPSASYD